MPFSLWGMGQTGRGEERHAPNHVRAEVHPRQGCGPSGSQGGEHLGVRRGKMRMQRKWLGSL